MPNLPQFGRRARLIAAGVLLLLLLLVVIFLRPLLHGPLMWFWRAPLPWFVAAVILIVGRLLSRRARLTVADLQAGRDPRRGVWAVSLGIASLAFFSLQAINPILVQRSLATHTEYAPINGLPETGLVRLVPREVAEQILVSGFNSSTERLTDLRVTNTKDGLRWSAIRTPEGVVRRYTKKSEGLILQDAEIPGRAAVQVDAQFKYAPGLAIFDSLTWQLRERHLFADLADPVGILDDEGQPLLLVPYLTYTGFPIRRPQLGGAFVVHPDGKIEDLSPEEARKRPEVVRSGRLYPDSLTRRQHDAYALRGGIWNYLFLHQDQTEIVDTETNRQPYLLQGPNDTTFWVSVAEPYGTSNATTAVFLTDSTTGRTQVWKVPEKQNLTGNARALKAVTSLNIPGVTFANSNFANQGTGAFRAIEPRPVFVKGSLYFVVSVIPDSANNVTRTVFVDARTNQPVGNFGSDAEGLRATLDFLKNGPDASTVDEAPSTTTDQPQGTTPAPTTPTSTTPPTRAELQQQVNKAIQRQQDAIDELRALQQQLEQVK